LHAAKVAKKRNTPIAGLILNKAHGKGFEITKEEIEDAAGVPVLAELPADLRVLESLANTTPSTLSGPMRELSIRYKHLAAQLLGKEYKDPRMSAKVRNFFSALAGKGRR
jgi:MinD-like ATPase involved in chromosome partitioning or flagellar assembly